MSEIVDIDELMHDIFNKKNNVPEKLEDLYGEYNTTIHLKKSIDWSPGKRDFDTRNVNELTYAYTMILSEGSLEDVSELINKDRLVEVWNNLFISPDIRNCWNDRFSNELGES